MLENIEGEDVVERRVAKRKMVRVAHDIGVPKNLVLELDAIRVALGRSARADMKNEIIPLPENLFVLSADRVAGVLARDFHLLGYKNRHALSQLKRAGAIFTVNLIAFFIEPAMTNRTNKNVLEAHAWFLGQHPEIVKEGNLEASSGSGVFAYLRAMIKGIALRKTRFSLARQYLRACLGRWRTRT